ncbi:TadE family protein [uncultured Clostridium sp.]|uniref:TadE/TadG family type IV pilus assembly protein n=1 Tax=uncultured Clostridium sp. TaxID=59620 RepID=UPI0025EFAFB8|nr:TadE family protein [uncultured Clostridium sp.]
MEKNKGSLSIEAALVIPIFVFFVLTLTNFAKMIMVYDSVQSSINNTAKQISSQSFYLSSTGLDSVLAKLTANDGSQNAETTVALIKEITNMFSSSNSNLPTIGQSNSSDFYNFFKSIRDDLPKYSAYSLFALFDLFSGDSVQAQINNYVQGLAKNNLILDITNGNGAEESIKALGIIGGEDGIKFDETTCKISDDESYIEIIVSYEYDPGNIFFDVDPIEMKHRVYIVPWLGN